MLTVGASLSLRHRPTGVELQEGFRQARHSALLFRLAAVLLLTPVTFNRGRVLAVGAVLSLGHRPTRVELQEGFRQAQHSAPLPRLECRQHCITRPL